MDEYEDPVGEQSAELAKQATETFEEAVHARETGDNFVRTTVILAGVLFLIAVGQRFDVRGVRIGVLGPGRGLPGLRPRAAGVAAYSLSAHRSLKRRRARGA